MKHVATCFICSAMILVAVSSASAGDSAPPSWAYKVVEVSSPTDEQTLNGLGGEGWELVTVVQSLVEEGRFFLYFKRLRKADDIDLPFVDDPAVVGVWASVDFVADPTEFDPNQRRWEGDLLLKEAVFDEGGKTPRPWATWTKGVLIHHGERTASAYTFQRIGGTDYMFLEWKSGDYTIRYRKPHYYVLKKK